METAQDILKELEPLGRAAYKRLLMHNHGVREPCFGVAIGAMKPIQKRVKKDHRLALDLYATGNYDAMYLAGLIADDARMTREDLQTWVEQAYGGSLPGSTVPSVAAGSPYGHEMALEWIESPQPLIAAAGWATLSSLVSIKPDAELDLHELERLLQRVQRTLHQAPDAVRYQMNSFVICVGSYVPPLTDLAIQTAEAIGSVNVDMGNNDCLVPSAPEYIRKVQAMGRIGKKRKSAKC
jgi:hypothetical protein